MKPLTAAMAESFPASRNCELFLLSRYGATMSLRDLATELGSTPNALRIRQLRSGDLPARILGIRGYRWPTTAVAAWISGLTGAVDPPTHFDEIAPTREAKPRGRPRRRRSAADSDVWGAT